MDVEVVDRGSGEQGENGEEGEGKGKEGEVEAGG